MGFFKAKTLYRKICPAPLRARIFWLRQYLCLPFALATAARHISQHSLHHQGRKLFIDCGFNTGYITEGLLKRLSPEFYFYAFEANSAFKPAAEHLQERYPGRVKTIFSAASDHNGRVKLREAGNGIGMFQNQESTIVSGINPSTPIIALRDVSSIDFSGWLQTVHKEHTNGNGPPYMAVKMDIEGAEFRVLAKMIADGSLNLVTDLFVEFHSCHFDQNLQIAKKKREKKLRAAIQRSGVHLHECI